MAVPGLFFDAFWGDFLLGVVVALGVLLTLVVGFLFSFFIF